MEFKYNNIIGSFYPRATDADRGTFVSVKRPLPILSWEIELRHCAIFNLPKKCIGMYGFNVFKSNLAPIIYDIGTIYET